MFNVLIITKESPDIWLEIFGYEMDVDHGEGEQSDHDHEDKKSGDVVMM